MRGRITEGFRNILEMRWSDYVEAEQEVTNSNFDSVIYALVKACRRGNLRAIQVALVRPVGKIATEIEVE